MQRFMSSENHIPGIYNWCDRWCEKCPFINRCAVGEVEKELLDADDEDAEAFEQKLLQSFEDAMEKLDEMAEEMGFDPEDTDPEEEAEIEAEMNLQNIIIDTHPLPDFANQYLNKVESWFAKDEIKQLLKAYEDALDYADKPMLDMGAALTFNECVDIIYWYKFFIPAKCHRMIGETQDEFWDDEPPHTRPYNGTAKITLIAIERSIAAWSSLSELLKDYKSQMEPFLRHLKQLRGMIDDNFPDAQLFVRPGFDE